MNIRLATIVIIAGFSIGCSSQVSQLKVGGGCHVKNFSQLLQATNLKEMFQGVAMGLCSDSMNQGASGSCGGSSGEGRRKTILVTDFVDLQSFMPNSQGLLMGELMRGSLNNACCYDIVQAEFGKFFNLSEKGLVVLTRKAEEIKNDAYPRPEVIAGTYSYLNDKIIVFVRRIDTATGSISRMVTREIDYDCNSEPIRYTVK